MLLWCDVKTNLEHCYCYFLQLRSYVLHWSSVLSNGMPEVKVQCAIIIEANQADTERKSKYLGNGILLFILCTSVVLVCDRTSTISFSNVLQGYSEILVSFSFFI